ncbi:hypothetical protein KEM52_004417, partial [Ascosphaera acerosa]
VSFDPALQKYYGASREIPTQRTPTEEGQGLQEDDEGDGNGEDRRRCEAKLNINRVKYFKWTPRTAWITFVYAALVPGILGTIAYKQDVS